MSPPPLDPRAQQAMFQAKGKGSGGRDGSVKAGIWKAVLFIGVPVTVAVVVFWVR